MLVYLVTCQRSTGSSTGNIILDPNTHLLYRFNQISHWTKRQWLAFYVTCSMQLSIYTLKGKFIEILKVPILLQVLF